MEPYKIVVPVVMLLVAMFALRVQVDHVIGKATHPSDTASFLPATTPITGLCGASNNDCKDLITQIAGGAFAQP